jgi:hypothetical protein
MPQFESASAEDAPGADADGREEVRAAQEVRKAGRRGQPVRRVPQEEEGQVAPLTEPAPEVKHYYNGPKDYVWLKEFPDGVAFQEAVAGMLDKLSARQRTYVAARVRGRTASEARKLIGLVSNHGTDAWEDAPWWESACAKERAFLFGNKQDTLLPLLPAAITRLKEEISGQYGDDLAHTSSIWIAEQIYGKPQQTSKVTNDGAAAEQGILAVLRGVAQIVEAMPDSEQKALQDGSRASVVEAQSRSVGVPLTP